MLTAHVMKLMGDEHLVATIRADFDPLTATDIEIELLHRFEKMTDGSADNAEMNAALDEFDITAKDIKTFGDALVEDVTTSAAILKVIHEAGISSATAMQAELDLARRFSALAEDAGDTFFRLSKLIEGVTV